MSILLLLFCIGLLIYATTRLKIHPFLALLAVALIFGLGSGMSVELILRSFSDGFGNTLGSIGLVILLGVIIGAFLEQTGGAYTLANLVLKVLGKKRVTTGMSLIGYLVSIPVFADSGFIILSPLNKALTKRAGLSLSVTAIALAIGLLASHSLVPPTPGPIAAAGILSADLGLVILYGILVSLLAMILPVYFIKRVGPRFPIDPNPDLSEDDMEALIRSGPPASLAVLPILIPIILIILKSLNDYNQWLTEGFIYDSIQLLGAPVIALSIGLLSALLLPAKLEKTMLSDQGWVGAALRDAAIILVITGAGGVFGKVLQNSSLPETLNQTLGTLNLGIWLPFIIAAALKTAQGSSTVAMITTASIVAPMTTSLGMDTDLTLALGVLSIGAGSTVVSHAPDSFFWVVTQMSNMTVNTGYRLHAVASGLFGISAISIIFIIWCLAT